MRWRTAVASLAILAGVLATGCGATEPDGPTDDAAIDREAEPAPLTEQAPVVARDRPQRSAVRLDPRCEKGRVLCADKSTRTMRWVVDGEVKLTFAARFGGKRTPTREGRFEVYAKDRHHVSSLYGTPMPFTMFFDGGQAVHYSKEFATEGYAGASHGCVNIRDYRRLEKLFNRVRVGDKVIVYRSASIAS